MKRIARTPEESDVFSRKARRIFYWTQRAGACKEVKRGANRRDRRQAKDAIRRGTDAQEL
jgi:hypothetical protein